MKTNIHKTTSGALSSTPLYINSQNHWAPALLHPNAWEKSQFFKAFWKVKVIGTVWILVPGKKYLFLLPEK